MGQFSTWEREISNANELAYPLLLGSYPTGDSGYVKHECAPGMTKREAFAMAAMQGYIAAGSTGMPEPVDIAMRARVTADALLAELERTP